MDVTGLIESDSELEDYEDLLYLLLRRKRQQKQRKYKKRRFWVSKYFPTKRSSWNISYPLSRALER